MYKQFPKDVIIVFYPILCYFVLYMQPPPLYKYIERKSTACLLQLFFASPDKFFKFVTRKWGITNSHNWLLTQLECSVNIIIFIARLINDQAINETQNWPDCVSTL